MSIKKTFFPNKRSIFRNSHRNDVFSVFCFLLNEKKKSDKIREIEMLNSICHIPPKIKKNIIKANKYQL